MVTRFLAAAAAVVLSAGIAAADSFTDTIVADLTGQGFTFIEIRNGLSQVKVEAVRGTEKLEVIFERSTGSILKQEMERAEADEIGRTGVRIRNRARDFVRAAPATGTPGVTVPPATPGTGPAPGLPGGNVASAQALLDELAAQGFTFFEVKNGPTQTKVEAIRGAEEVEIIFDRASGAILTREVGAADAEDIGRTGLEIDTRNRDFLRLARAGGEHSGSAGSTTTSAGGSGSSGSGSGSGSSGSNSGSGSSESESESSSSGSGSSNSGSGSSNSGSGSSNSGSGSSNSGSGSSNSGSGSDD